MFHEILLMIIVEKETVKNWAHGMNSCYEKVISNHTFDFDPTYSHFIQDILALFNSSFRP